MRFTAADLNALPRPEAIEALDYEAMLDDYRARLIERLTIAGEDYDVGRLETDPGIIIGEAVQYQRLIDRARVNDAVRAVLVLASWGSNLDALGARVETARLPDESDDRYRYRIVMAYEALATTGTYGGYQYFALGASTDVHTCTVYGPESGMCEPGQALIVVAARNTATGQPEPASTGLTDLVHAECARRDRRPLTDQVIVRSARLRPYNVVAQMVVRSHIDPAIARQTAERRIVAYTQSVSIIGERVSREGIVAALAADGEGRVMVDAMTLVEPTADIVPAGDEVPWCTSVNVTARARE